MESEAEVELTLDDNSVFNRAVDTGRSTIEMPPTTPRQIDYGDVTVGTTTAARPEPSRRPSRSSSGIQEPPKFVNRH